ncbi:MAG: EamA family transporter [Pseudorhodobacter sp.]|nr:EamA family transporter [Pseudorhodobacter sp.]
MSTPDHRLGLILVGISTLSWSTAGLFTRAIQADLFAMLFWRGAFSVLGLLVVLVLLRGAGSLKTFLHLGLWGWIYAAASTAALFCYISSFRLTSVAHVAIIYAIVPFCAAGLSWLMLKQRPKRDAILASSVALIGAVVMVGFGNDGHIAGDILAFIMTILMALMIVISRRYPLMPNLHAGIVSIFAASVISLPLAGSLAQPPDQLLLLAVFGLVNSTLGFAMFAVGSPKIAPIETALLCALEAPIAPLWVWLAFGERPSPITIAGATLVFAAVTWHIARQSRSANLLPVAPP